jgi:ribose-phosphate pyrophosphokinase
VPDDHPPYSPAMSASSRNGDSQHSPADDEFDALPDAMLSSVMSHTSTRHGKGEGLGGSADAVASDDEEDHLVDPEVESTVTLVGNVRGRPVFILDDMIDKAASWVAAAETVVKRGGATKVYCFATHGTLYFRQDPRMTY